MTINKEKYKLPLSNYLSIESEKTWIALGHTFNHDMKHFIGWQHRYNGEYKKTAAYTIAKDGTIYEHFDPSFTANVFDTKEFNMKTIVILMENDGWLVHNTFTDEYLTWFGDIYKDPKEVVSRRWRGYSYWAPYSEEQLESAVLLSKHLCRRFNIPMVAIGHNTKSERLVDYQGVLCKSNIEKHYTDLNPSWDCELFKSKLEQ